MIRQLQKRLYFESETDQFYWECTTEESEAIADKLGYRTAAEWDVLLLPPSADGDPTWWDRRETPGHGAIRELRSSDTVSITEVRGSQEY